MGPANPLELAFFERLVSGSPLIVVTSLIIIFMLWRFILSLLAQINVSQQREQERSDTQLREVLQAVGAMNATVTHNTNATEALIRAIGKGNVS